MDFDYNDVVSDDGYFKGNTLLTAFLGVFFVFTSLPFSYYYFSYTNIQIITNKIIYVNLFSFIISFFEVAMFAYIKNKNRNLAKYSVSQFDNSDGCMVLIAMLFGGFFFNGIVLSEINGRFDFYKGTKKKVEIVKKNKESFFSKKYKSDIDSFTHFYLVVENEKENISRFSFQVSKSIYERFNEKTIIEFETKPGLLGLEHLSSKITLAK